jgi:hypothetical protein
VRLQLRRAAGRRCASSGQHRISGPDCIHGRLRIPGLPRISGRARIPGHDGLPGPGRRTRARARAAAVRALVPAAGLAVSALTGLPAASAVSGAAAAGCPARQLLGNAGFESGKRAPWTGSADVITRSSAAVRARAGSWLAWLDGFGTTHTDTLAQTVTIPAGCQAATLSFWLKITSADPRGKASDTFTVTVTGPSGAAPVTVASFSNRNRSRHYARHTVPLTSYIGQTVTITMTGSETLVGGDTSFFEDGNALRVS